MAAMVLRRHGDRARRPVREAVRAEADAQPDGAGGSALGGAAAASTLPLTFDVQIDAPSALRVENNIAHMVASANLKLQGTYDHPVLFGTAEIERGDIIFEGNRYLVTRGSIGFANPIRIEPYFDIEAETRVRVPGQTYRVTLGFTGTHIADVAESQFRSAAVERRHCAAAVRSVREPRGRRAARAEPGRDGAFAGGSAQGRDGAAADRERVGAGEPRGRADARRRLADHAVDGVADGDPLTPRPGSSSASGCRTAPTSRLRGRSASAAREQILVLEYDQNDRLGWVLTSNGDRTFSVDFRVQHRR